MGRMDRIGDQIKETVTLTKVSTDSVNEWGDASTSESTVEIHGRFDIMARDQDEVEEGDYREGDLRGFVDSRWDSDISHEDKLTYNGQDFRIHEVYPKRTAHDNKHLEIRASPV